MLYLGDVFAIVVTLTGIFLSVWAMIVGLGLLFDSKVTEAAERIEANPLRQILLGALIAVVPGVLTFAMAVSAFPMLKLLGLIGLLSILLVGVFGAGGIAKVIGKRISSYSPETNSFSAYSKGAALMVGSCFVPILGWLFVAPLFLFASLGAGWSGLRVRSSSSELVA